MAWRWDLWEWKGAYPRAKANDYHTWGWGCILQEDREVFHTMFGIVIGDMWGLSFCDSIFGGVEKMM